MYNNHCHRVTTQLQFIIIIIIIIIISFMQGTYIPETNYVIIIIIIIINCNWVVTRWQWLFYMYTEYEIDYY